MNASAGGTDRDEQMDAARCQECGHVVPSNRNNRVVCARCGSPWPPDTDAARGAGLTPLASATIRTAFRARHDSELMRDLARTSIRDARLWLRLFGRFPYGSR